MPDATLLVFPWSRTKRLESVQLVARMRPSLSTATPSCWPGPAPRESISLLPGFHPKMPLPRKDTITNRFWRGSQVMPLGPCSRGEVSAGVAPALVMRKTWSGPGWDDFTARSENDTGIGHVNRRRPARLLRR